ncbi:hypothetical protein F7725_019960 [Dissostichus mawsoni]|uniref:Sphingomyelin phosphodiesterase C-terminal domain-containing protein n=1 Tax=Dissostichus mawsoni TaxID=36200 RepID=A0A7J5YML2_DISMA|nr:hypothetical protein F7725_019960 [Dissostichus mawsoni]
MTCVHFLFISEENDLQWINMGLLSCVVPLLLLLCGAAPLEAAPAKSSYLPAQVCSSSKGVPATNPGMFGDFLCDSPYRLIQDSPPHVPAGELSTDLVVQDQMPTSTNAVYRAAAELWRPWLQNEALLTLSQGGFYSQLVKPGLRVVSLNTILYYGPNKVTENMTDPAGQLENTTAVREKHNERLVSIFRKYSDIIAGHFYGHTHQDSIMVLLDQQGKPVNSLFVSPAVTPIKTVLQQPSFRMYLYDTEDFSMQDIWQYFLNLTEANERQSAAWRREYVLREAFGLADLKPLSLLKLGLSFMEQSTAFDSYFNTSWWATTPASPAGGRVRSARCVPCSTWTSCHTPDVWRREGGSMEEELRGGIHLRGHFFRYFSLCRNHEKGLKLALLLPKIHSTIYRFFS